MYSASSSHSWPNCPYDGYKNYFCLSITVWITASESLKGYTALITLNQPLNLHHITISFTSSTCIQTHLVPTMHHPTTTLPHVWPKCLLKVLPAVACKSSRERKQQIKTVPFMMAARRTLIVTQTIYTKAGRLKGTQREEAGHREGQLLEGLRAVCWRCCRSHSMPRGLYVCKQLTLLLGEVAARVSA